MSKLRALSLLLSFAFLCSCAKERISCFTPPEPTLIRLVDKNETDLLNPGNPNGYKFMDVRLYYLEDGRKVFSNLTLDSLPGGKGYFLNTDISWKADQGRDFYLQLSSATTDRIFLRYDHVSEKGCGFFRFVEFKYNGLIYNKKKVDGYIEAFEIVK